MAKQERQGILNRLVQGWQQMVGSIARNDRFAAEKPFPPNKFYSPEELNFLDQENADNLTEVDKWALALSKQEFSKSGKKADLPFVPVQWTDGLLSTYHNGKVKHDDISSQAERLMLLKVNGYELPAKYNLFLDNYEAAKLEGSIFKLKDEQSFLQIESVDKRPGQSPVLNTLTWQADDPINVNVDSMDYSDFKSQYGSKIFNLSKEEQSLVAEELSRVNEGKALFDQTISLIKNATPSMFGNTFPDYQQKIDTDLTLGGLSMVPIFWQITNNDTIKLKYRELFEDRASSCYNDIELTRNNAYKAQELITLINDGVQAQYAKNRVHSLISVIGRELGTSKVVNLDEIPSRPERLSHYDLAVATNEGEVKVFNFTNHKEIPLSANDLVQIRDLVELKAKNMRQELRDKVSVAEFGDFYDSLNDKTTPLSGDEDLIPRGSTFSHLYNQFYTLVEDFHGNKLSMAQEEKDSYMNTYTLAYKKMKNEFDSNVQAYKVYSAQIKLTRNNAIDSVEKMLGADHSANAKADLTPGQAAYRLLHNREYYHPIKELRGAPLQQEIATRTVLNHVVKAGALPAKEEIPEDHPSSKLGLDVFHHIHEYNQTLDKLDEVVDGKQSGHKRHAEMYSDIFGLSTEEKTEVAHYVEPGTFQTPIGRWHTQEHQQEDAYREYGRLLSDSEKLSANTTWMEPRDIEGNKYRGVDALMLQLETREKGYTSPLFVSLSTAAAQGIKIQADAKPFPLVTPQGVEKVFNLSLTDYPLHHPIEFKEKEQQAFVDSRLQQMAGRKLDIKNLVNHPLFSTKTQFDESSASVRYDAKENEIHLPIAMTDIDSKREELARGLIMSTRKQQSSSQAFEPLVKEDLIAYVGAAMLGNLQNFEVTPSDSHRFVKERLKTDPDYTREVLQAAARSSSSIISYLNDIDEEVKKNPELDMRSLTPVDLDTDGNGIIDNTENLAPDKKQGEEEQKTTSDISKQEHSSRRMR